MRKGQSFTNARYCDRLLARTVTNSNGCMEVKASLKNGYGKVVVRGEEIYAHRFVWETKHGSIPEGTLVLHDCDNPKCINPNHLHLGDHSMNSTEFVARHRHHSQKIEHSDVPEIRRRFDSGESLASIGRAFNISDVHAGRIAHNQTWRFL